MSLFETLSDMSKQHAESGSYKFESPVTEPEPAPTVSLYNLLDHSYDQLFVLLQAARIMEIEVRPNKLSKSFTYTTLCSWILILETAIKERQDRDSLAWAEKTAKEIKETLS